MLYKTSFLRYKILAATSIFLFISTVVSSQDPSFSQFYANKIYLNPAFAGIERGLNLTASYRNQWSSVPGGFTTYSVSADLQEPCLKSAFSVSAFHDMEGEAAFQSSGFNAIYVYTLPFDFRHSSSKSRLGKGNVHFGFKGGFVQQSLDWDKLIFSDQLDPVYGVVNPTVAQLGFDQVSFPDFSSGFVWRQNWIPRNRRGFKSKQTIRTAFGVSWHHMLRPIQSFNGIETPYPSRWTVHLGARIPVTPFGRTTAGRKVKFYITPNFKWDRQGENAGKLNLATTNILTYGCYFQTPSPLYFGLMIQHQHLGPDIDNTDALITTLGYELGERREAFYTIGASYDYNIGGLANRSGGVFEDSFRARFKSKRIFCKGKAPGMRNSDEFILDCDNFF